jgi:GNAT superfamily N-acetyltransferase
MIELRNYGHADILGLRQTLIDVNADVYVEIMNEPFHQRFPWFVDTWGAKPDFTCVLAWDGESPTGFIYGAAATVGHEWWREHWNAPQGDTSTFHVSELMVRSQWRKTGLSTRIHDALIAQRGEAIACLLVDVAHPRVQALYESWGYFKVGETQPFPDSPVDAIMVKFLRSSQLTI